MLLTTTSLPAIILWREHPPHKLRLLVSLQQQYQARGHRPLGPGRMTQNIQRTNGAGTVTNKKGGTKGCE